MDCFIIHIYHLILYVSHCNKNLVLQGQPLGFDTKYLALVDRNMQVRFSLKPITLCQNLMVDPVRLGVGRS